MRIKSFAKNKYVIFVFIVFLLCTSYYTLTGMTILYYFEKSQMDVNADVQNIIADSSTSTVKRIALTFDDGPSDKTPKILEILKKENAKATFFVIGKYAEESPEILKQEIAEGHEVENHSYDHSKFLTRMSPNELLDNVNKAESVIEKATGEKAKLFRPPYGNINFRMERILVNAGYKIILWDIDPRDWDIANQPESVEKYVLNNAMNTAVILLHDGKSVYQGSDSKKITDQNSEEILQDLIERLKADGYEFVTLNDLYNK